MNTSKEINKLLLKNANHNQLTDYEIEQLREFASQDSENILGMLSEIAELVHALPHEENKQIAYKRVESDISFYLTQFERKIKKTPELINLQAVDLSCCPTKNQQASSSIGETLIELISKCSINPVLYAKAIRLGAKVTPPVERNFAYTANEKRQYMNPLTAHKQINKVNELFLNSNVLLNNWIESGKKLTPHEIKTGAARLPKSVQKALFNALKELQKGL